MSSTKQKQFLKLAEHAGKCVICPDLADKQAVLSEMNGNIDPRVMFIAEAPGRQGADRTRKPFWGDKWISDDWFYFDSFMLLCVKTFIRNGLYFTKSVNLELRKLLQATKPEFVDFMNE